MGHKKIVGRCPSCNHSIAYSNNSRNRNNIFISVAPKEYNGTTILCAKCKTMLIFAEKPKVATRYLPIPVVENIVIL